MSLSGVVIREIEPADPARVALALKNRPGLAFLDSGADDHGLYDRMLGRWSFVSADPFARFEVRQGRAIWNSSALDEEPLTALKTKLAAYQTKTDPAAPPFQTGAMGFIGYDFGGQLDAVPHMPEADAKTAALSLGFYDVIFAHDHQDRRSFILASGWPERDDMRRRARAEARIAEFLEAIKHIPEPLLPPQTLEGWRSNFSAKTYETAVTAVIEAILRGDIFQANLSQRFMTTLPEAYDPLAFYMNLRALSPAPFGAYLALGDLTLASNSPERFLSLCHGAIEARPIKGTAPRSSNKDEDRAFAAALLASEKDRAENTMIVDLLRNDLSRVSQPGSVKVPTLCGLETYANVHHLVSVVEGRLKSGLDASDVVRAAFPGGSITGAPKRKAMELIGQLEGIPRGAYCGSMGYFGFDGTMDLNIAIRTASFTGNTVQFSVGGGITALSDPKAEYQETLVKAERLFKAFGSSLDQPVQS